MTLTLTKTSLSLEAARQLVKAAMMAGAARGHRVAVAVVDQEGALLAFERMDGVPAPIVEFSIDKAYTSAVTGAPTRDFFEHINASESLRLGIAGRPRLLVWGGGMPARHDGAVIGGIGVSGGPEDDDIACAGEALRTVGLS
ncbi:MAG: heme-binding protein [Rhizobium sp.]|nr:heme-binding protein [Rhizobium sp.]